MGYLFGKLTRELFVYVQDLWREFIHLSFYYNFVSIFFQRSLEGHIGDIYSAKLFPSGVVILTSGADMRLKIWSAEDGSCPRTLTGHTAPVTDTAIVDKGMNIVSVSK